MSANNGHKPLAPQHQKLIVDSAITPDVSAERGYWTASKAIGLQRLGFSNVQAIGPRGRKPAEERGSRSLRAAASATVHRANVRNAQAAAARRSLGPPMR